MRPLLLFLFFAFLALTSPGQVPSRSEMDAQMKEMINAINKQITDLEKQIAGAKKNKEDPESIKEMEDQLKILKQQAGMMTGLNKSISAMPEKTFSAANEETLLVPKKDITRINSLPKSILPKAQLLLHIKKVHAGIEKIIGPLEKKEAIEIYNQTKKESSSPAIVANAASGCWMLGHWEKALIIMGLVCMDDMDDADNLNNYASFLVSSGGEQAAVPILEYLNSLYPRNSTILNNLGQAWFGLGDVQKAKKYLESVTVLHANHSTANATLSDIYQAEGNNEKAISFLKAALKETYDPEKESQLNKLGVKLRYADMPDFNYPMQKDPTGFFALFNSLPEDYPSYIGDNEKVKKINRYVNGMNKLEDFLRQEMLDLTPKITERDKKLAMDIPFQREFLASYDCPAYKLARRSVELIGEEKIGSRSLISQMLLPGFRPQVGARVIKTEDEVYEECLEVWENEYAKPLADYAYAMKQQVNANPNCIQADAITNAYMAKEASLKKAAIVKIKRIAADNRISIETFTKLVLYSIPDDPPKDDAASWDIVSMQLDYAVKRKKYKDGVAFNFLNKADQIVKKLNETKSACDGDILGELTPEGEDNLAPLIVKNVKCEFVKKFETPVVVYALECNAIKTKTKNLKKKSDPVKKGKGHSSKRRSNRSGPLGSGPFIEMHEPDGTGFFNQPGPLTSESKDPSQFSIEYDTWGNLIGFDFQLNEEGTGLKDPESAESPLDSRWSWNAVASSKKGFLNLLLIK